MNIAIKDLFGIRCIVADDGQRLHDIIVDNLKGGSDIYLDFSEVRQFASPFFNYAIGQLLSEFSESQLRELLHLHGLNETGKAVVERVIENAAQYHGSRDYKAIVDDILERQAKGGE